MALIDCPDCSQKISSSAKRCVHCGYQKIQTVLFDGLGFDGTLFRTMMMLGIIIFLFGIPNFSAMGVGMFLIFSGYLGLLIRALR